MYHGSYVLLVLIIMTLFQYHLSKQLMKQAFSMMSFGEIGGNEELDANDALEQGEQAADRAIEMMEQVSHWLFLHAGT